MTSAHSGASASIPSEGHDAVVLADTLQAFDLLHTATCGKAPLDELVAHYGVKNAHQIMQAREQIARTRAAAEKARTHAADTQVGTSNASEPKNIPANGDSQ